MSEALWFPISLTLRACGASCLLFALVAVPLAYLCARRQSAATRVLMFVCTLPLIFPPVALGYLLLVFGIHGPLGAPLDAWLDVRIIFSQTACAWRPSLPDCRWCCGQ